MLLSPSRTWQTIGICPVVWENGSVCPTHACCAQDVDAMLCVTLEDSFIGVGLVRVVMLGMERLSNEFLGCPSVSAFERTDPLDEIEWWSGSEDIEAHVLGYLYIPGSGARGRRPSFPCILRRG